MHFHIQIFNQNRRDDSIEYLLCICEGFSVCVLSDLVLEPFHDPGRGSGTVNQTHPQHPGGLGHLKEEVKQVFFPENHLDTGVCRKIYLCSLCKRHRTIGLIDVLCHKSNATFLTVMFNVSVSGILSLSFLTQLSNC